MPMDKSLYPKDWDAIALAIKTEVAWACEECGRPCRHPGESVEALLNRLYGTAWAQDLYEVVDDPVEGLVSIPHPQRFCLTVAHLDHHPEHCDRANLRAWCAPCHCRYDLRAMDTKRRLKSERAGQLTLTLE
jgi:hypothetical protein